MNQKIAKAMVSAFVVGVPLTTFAAANPFSDVPAGHWAYSSVTKLAAQGIIEGYGDGTYRGDRNITRYEMAQMVAKALAKDTSGASKAMLDRLAAEFRDELNSLGVRVHNLEKYADKVSFGGKLEYTYTSGRTDPYNTGTKQKTNSNGYVFRLEPVAEVNNHWKVKARIDGKGDLKNDKTTDITLERAWVEGEYDKFNLSIGKLPFYPDSEEGLIWDTTLSGAKLSVGSKWKFNAWGGRIEDDKVQAGINGLRVSDLVPNYNTDPSTIVGVRVDYDQGEEGLFGGGGWYRVNDSDLAYQKRGYNPVINGKGEDKADIWTANLGYRFSDLLKVSGGYARNSKADWEKDSWQAELRYGDFENEFSRTGDWRDRTLTTAKGQWSVWGGYRKFGSNLSYVGTIDDDAFLGTRGWIAGLAWAPFDNVGLIAKYFNGKYITDVNGDKGKAERLFGRVAFYF